MGYGLWETRDWEAGSSGFSGLFGFSGCPNKTNTMNQTDERNPIDEMRFGAQAGDA